MKGIRIAMGERQVAMDDGDSLYVQLRRAKREHDGKSVLGILGSDSQRAHRRICIKNDVHEFARSFRKLSNIQTSDRMEESVNGY